MLIIKVPEDTYLLDLSEEVQEAVSSVNGQFCESQMIGTKTINGEKLVFIYAEVTRVEIEALIGTYDLDWQVMAIENEVVDQELLLPYFEDEPVFVEREGGEPETIYQPIADLTNKLQVWAGKSWKYS
jgi:hypothetical protein